MESAGKRRRSREAGHGGHENSLIANFLELRESELIQTGPKRPRWGGDEMWLTPLENIGDSGSRRRRSSKSTSRKKSTRKSVTLKSPVKLTSPVGNSDTDILNVTPAISRTTHTAEPSLRDQTPASEESEKNEQPPGMEAPSEAGRHEKTSDVGRHGKNSPETDENVAPAGHETSHTAEQSVAETPPTKEPTSERSAIRRKLRSALKDVQTVSSLRKPAAGETWFTPLENLGDSGSRRRRSSKSTSRKKSTRKSVTLKSPVKLTLPVGNSDTDIPVISGPTHTAEPSLQDQTPPASEESEEKEQSPIMETLPKVGGHEKTSPEVDENEPSQSLHSDEQSVAETPTTKEPTSGCSSTRRKLRSALKDMQMLSSLRRQAAGNNRVSFGRFVTVAEYSPDRYHSLTLTDESLLQDNSLSPEIGLTSSSSSDEGKSTEEEVQPAETVSSDSSENGSANSAGESSETSMSSMELEPLGDEEQEIENGKEDELEVVAGEPQVEEMSKSTSKNQRKRSSVVVCKKKKKLSKTLPRALIKNLFTLSSKRRVTKNAMDLIAKFSEVYLKQAGLDLAAYTAHAGRRTIDLDDVVLLLRRQRLISEKQPFEYQVNKHLPLEYVEELLPCALAGKEVIPPLK